MQFLFNQITQKHISMTLKRTKLLGIQAVTGINTVGIMTVGVTTTAGGVGVASTIFVVL